MIPQTMVAAECAALFRPTLARARVASARAGNSKGPTLLAALHEPCAKQHANDGENSREAMADRRSRDCVTGVLITSSIGHYGLEAVGIFRRGVS
jgi:hypothetical protein